MSRHRSSIVIEAQAVATIITPPMGWQEFCDCWVFEGQKGSIYATVYTKDLNLRLALASKDENLIDEAIDAHPNIEEVLIGLVNESEYDSYQHHVWFSRNYELLKEFLMEQGEDGDNIIEDDVISQTL